MRGGQYTNALVAGLDAELEPYRSTLLVVEDHILRTSNVTLSYISSTVEEVRIRF